MLSSKLQPKKTDLLKKEDNKIPSGTPSSVKSKNKKNKNKMDDSQISNPDEDLIVTVEEMLETDMTKALRDHGHAHGKKSQDGGKKCAALAQNFIKLQNYANTLTKENSELKQRMIRLDDRVAYTKTKEQLIMEVKEIVQQNNADLKKTIQNRMTCEIDREALIKDLKESILEEVQVLMITTLKQEIEKIINIQANAQQLPSFAESVAMLKEVKDEIAISNEAIRLELENSNQELREEIRSGALTQLKEVIRNELTTQIKETIQLERGDIIRVPSDPSYADMVNFPVLPTRKPAIIINTKSSKTAINDIKSTLNKIERKDLPKLETYITKGNKMILKCDNDEDLKQIKQRLVENEDFEKLATISDPKPRRIRLFVMGAPYCDEDLKEEYVKEIIKPSIKAVFNRDKVDCELIRCITNKRDNTESHLIIEMNEDEGRIFMAQRRNFAFNRCTVKKYTLLLRCFNCQQFGHGTRTCTTIAYCGYCAEKHTSDDCTRKCAPRCINCLEENCNRKNMGKKFNTDHPAFEATCPTYRLYFKHLEETTNNPVKPQKQ